MERDAILYFDIDRDFITALEEGFNAHEGELIFSEPYLNLVSVVDPTISNELENIVGSLEADKEKGIGIPEEVTLTVYVKKPHENHIL